MITKTDQLDATETDSELDTSMLNGVTFRRFTKMATSQETNQKKTEQELEKKYLQNAELAGWVGLVEFEKFISQFNKKFVFCNISPFVYQFVKLLPEFGERYGVEKYTLRTYDLNTFADEDETVELSENELMELSAKSEGRTILLNDSQAIDGFLSDILPSFFENRDSFKFRSPWYKDCTDEADFWVNLLNFWTSCLQLSEDMIRTESASLVVILGKICEKTKMMVSTFQGIADADDLIDPSELQVLQNWIKEECDCTQSQVAACMTVSEMNKRRINHLIDSNELEDPSQLYAAIEAIGLTVSRLQLSLDDIENISYEASQFLVGINIKDVFEKIFQKIDSKGLSQEEFESICQNSGLDSSKVENWETLQEVFTEDVEEIQKMVEDCVIIFQGFDLLRQVIEHRLAESKLLMEKMEEVKGI